MWAFHPLFYINTTAIKKINKIPFEGVRWKERSIVWKYWRLFCNEEYLQK